MLPIATKEALLVGVVYPAVLLAHGCPVSLLLAMVCDIQNGLKILTEKLCKVKTVRTRDGSKKYKTPNPQIELLYTYLMAWFILHCPTLMTSILPQSDLSAPIV